MRKILVPFDGSPSALRAVRFAASAARNDSELHIELLHVLDPMNLRSHASLSSDDIKRLHADEAGRTLQPAMQILDEAGVPYKAEWRAGAAANEIADHVYEANCESIIMGTRGMSPIASLMIGSVATHVVHLVEVPVTLVK